MLSVSWQSSSSTLQTCVSRSPTHMSHRIWAPDVQQKSLQQPGKTCQLLGARDVLVIAVPELLQYGTALLQ